MAIWMHNERMTSHSIVSRKSKINLKLSPHKFFDYKFSNKFRTRLEYSFVDSPIAYKMSLVNARV